MSSRFSSVFVPSQLAVQPGTFKCSDKGSSSLSLSVCRRSGAHSGDFIDIGGGQITPSLLANVKWELYLSDLLVMIDLVENDVQVVFTSSDYGNILWQEALDRDT